MIIAVLCKWCPDPNDLEIGHDGTVTLERAQWDVSEYDRVAIEVALSLASAAASVVAVTAGPAPVASSMARKAILARGPEALYAVADDRLTDADARQTACALAAAIGRIGDLGLVICGAGSVDHYAQQVGAQVGERLGWPTLDEIASISLEDAVCLVERRLDDETQTLEVALPAVLAVTADAAVPRIPGMREILAAGKRPTTEWSLDDLAPEASAGRSSRVLSTLARKTAARLQVCLEGPAAESAEQLVDALRREGVV